MKLTPRSMARWRAASDVLSSVEPQSLPPMPQAPKPMDEIFQPVRPKVRYSIAPPCLLSSANAELSVAHSGLSRISAHGSLILKVSLPEWRARVAYKADGKP